MKKTLTSVRDTHWILLLIGGFLFMFAGSWLNQYQPERQERAARVLPVHPDHPGTHTRPAAEVYAHVPTP